MIVPTVSIIEVLLIRVIRATAIVKLLAARISLLGRTRIVRATSALESERVASLELGLLGELELLKIRILRVHLI